MKYLYLTIPFISLFALLSFKIGNFILVIGNHLFSSKNLCYTTLFFLFAVSLSIFFLRGKNLFINRYGHLLFVVIILSFLFCLVLFLLLYFLPDSIFYQPRRYISLSENNYDEKGVKVLYPALFKIILLIYFTMSSLVLSMIYISPNYYSKIFK